eukprot:gene22054-118_t
MNYTLQWHNKTRCHAPETIWLSNVPNASDPAGWRLDKLGSAVNPLDANLSAAGAAGPLAGCDPHRATCGVHLHGVGQGGATYVGPEGSFTFTSTDTSLLSVGGAIPVPTPVATPDPRGGMHWALVGNIWNTNYPFWYPFIDEDSSSQFRFQFNFQTPLQV